MTRWLLFLQQFNFDVVYKPGKKHGNADCLSRIPEAGDSQVVIALVQGIVDQDTIKEAQANDSLTKAALSAIKSGTQLPQRLHNRGKFLVKDGVLCCIFQESRGATPITQVVVPSSLTELVLKHLHDESGHFGKMKTIEKVRERFYWPGYESAVERWVKECPACQQRNPPQPHPKAPLGTISASYPFEKVSWDIMGPLPTSESGNKYILVITDLFTKWVEAFPLKVTDSVTLATILVNEVVCRYGVPSYIHSDQGANLNSDLIKSMCNLLGITRTRTSAYHPQGNGQVERFNRTVEAMIAKVIDANQRNWDVHLPKALFAYRTAVHESTRFTPFHVTFGRSPTLPVDAMMGTLPKPDGEEISMPQFVRQLHLSLKDTYTTVRQQLNQMHQSKKKSHDQEPAGSEFAIGERVWLYTLAIKRGRTKKFASLCRGPYTVVDKTGLVNYRIRLVGGSHTLIVHYNRLKPCYGEPVGRRRNTTHHAQANRSARTTQIGQTRTILTVEAIVKLCRTGQPLALLSGGYTVSTNDLPQSGRDRPTRNRRPPDYYGEFVSHLTSLARTQELEGGVM